jgi:hypothetical protein
VAETLDLDNTNNYTVPCLDNNVLNTLEMDSNNIIFNTEHKMDTYKNNPLFYVNYKDIIINVYGYLPANYKYVNSYYGLYLCSNKPFYYYGINPFTIEQHYIIINL